MSSCQSTSEGPILISASGALDGTIGGGQVYVQNLALELQRRGRELTLVAQEAWTGGPARWQVEWRTWKGIRVAGVSFDPAKVRLGSAWSDRPEPLLESLRQVVYAVRPRLIHINGLKAALTAVAQERSIPHVVTAHHAGIACPAGALLQPDDRICDRPLEPAACAACYCRQLQGGTVAGRFLAAIPGWVYRPAGRALNLSFNPRYVGRLMMYPWLVERSVTAKLEMLRSAARFIAPSRAIAEVLLRNGTPAGRITVVPHGIEPFNCTAIVGLGSRPVRFGYIGQINRPKGVTLLLQAFSRLAPGLAELEIIGCPQRSGEQDYLDAAMRPLIGRADVRLRGRVPHAEIGEALARIDVLVLPAIYLEVFGLVVLEALSAGRPVIVTRCGGPAEIVRDGIDGLIVAPNDVDALAAAMRELAAQPHRIIELAENIRPVRTLAEHVDDVEVVYREVGGGHDRRGSVPAADDFVTAAVTGLQVGE